jgi:hypothetical protein
LREAAIILEMLVRFQKALYSVLTWLLLWPKIFALSLQFCIVSVSPKSSLQP